MSVTNTSRMSEKITTVRAIKKTTGPIVGLPFKERYGYPISNDTDDARIDVKCYDCDEQFTLSQTSSPFQLCG